MSTELSDRELVTALEPPDGTIRSAVELRGAISARHLQRPHARRLIAAAAVAVTLVALAGGAVIAAAFIHTEPVTIHFTDPGPGDSGGSISGVTSKPDYRASLAQAQSAASFHILTLAPGAGTLESVTVSPPVTRANGKPLTPPATAAFELVYQLPSTSLQVDESAGPGRPLTVNVKSAGAKQSLIHVATVDGFTVAYDGSPDHVSNVMFETTAGVYVSMSTGINPLPGATPPAVWAPLTLDDWGRLLLELS